MASSSPDPDPFPFYSCFQFPVYFGIPLPLELAVACSHTLSSIREDKACSLLQPGFCAPRICPIPVFL